MLQRTDMPSEIRRKYEQDGFVLVPNIVPLDLLEELRAACDRVVARTRRGDWPHRRVIGKQFPPFGDADPDSWGVQHVMHPALGEQVFVKWYTSNGVVNTVKDLLGCDEEYLQMELFNLLINPEHHSFALRWHRDDIKETATEEEERNALTRWYYGMQWNTALYEDSCLFVVPGSHKVPRTLEQRALSQTLDAPKNPLDMPGATQVKLQPGETLFYNSNILHCATYSSAAKRATLHPTMGDARGGTVRARNILQHGVADWMGQPEFQDVLESLKGSQKERGVTMKDNLMFMNDKVKSEGVEVGYSLDG